MNFPWRSIASIRRPASALHRFMRRPAQHTQLAELGVQNSPADDRGPQRAHHGFDFGQFRHGREIHQNFSAFDRGPISRNPQRRR